MPLDPVCQKKVRSDHVLFPINLIEQRVALFSLRRLSIPHLHNGFASDTVCERISPRYKQNGGGAYEKSELSTNLSIFLGIPNGYTVSHRKERFEKEGETKPGR